ncbi:MAG TPA: glutamate racemase [Dehalococcoidia bacterium]|nr:glutamate racemase [Dehalococcoidia bacterium]
MRAIVEGVSSDGPIGVFDSGVGGLSVLWALQSLLPHESLLYFADQANFPYGPRPGGEVEALALDAGRRLVARGVKLVVVACNTASSAALPLLRERLGVPVVGIEPAVKPACAVTRTGRVGVLATAGTVQGTALAALVDRVAAGVEVIRAPAPGLVDLVERGELDSAEARARVAAALRPLRDAGVDVVALGCTHFAFLKPLVQDCLGPGALVLEPAAAVARQAARVLRDRGLDGSGGEPGTIRYCSSGDRAALLRQVERLSGGVLCP